ncbi:hypothetical protein [Nocardia sp. CA-135398]|uniref:hypothetical protein n=1 Tax=Nocardia sp. CA-135398 TaxID=3239977 RepID=UPI003D973375
MTSSDSGSSSQNQGNPFDTGLPMVRPAAAPQKRRRRPNARRGSGQHRTPLADALDPPERPHRPRPAGDWQEWLEPRRPADPPPEADRSRPRTRAVEAEAELPVETSSVVPTIIDRSGGNPGPALRHPPRRRDSQPTGGGNRVVAVLIVLGVVLAVVSVLMFVFGGSGEHKRSAAATTPAAAQGGTAGRAPATTVPSDEPSAIATPGCEQRRTGDVISGTDPGGTSDGPSAILAFERAYYVQRSGFAARGVVANDANVPAADQIQRGINQVPIGTLYCVQITRAGSDAGEAHWEVRLTQQRPGEEPQTFTQIITTRTAGNRTLITAINAG